MKRNTIESIISVISGIITIGIWTFTVIEELGEYENIVLIIAIVVTIVAWKINRDSGFYKGIKMRGSSLVTNEVKPVIVHVNFDKEFKSPPRVEIRPYMFKRPEISNPEVTTKGFTVTYYASSQSNSYKNGFKWTAYGEL